MNKTDFRHAPNLGEVEDQDRIGVGVLPGLSAQCLYDQAVGHDQKILPREHIPSNAVNVAPTFLLMRTSSPVITLCFFESTRVEAMK
jgi:hypothetical protein